MTKEKIEEIKHILFHEYSWASTEIDKLDLHINDVIEATEQAINVIQCCMGEAEQLPIARCGCEEPDPTEIKVCVQCDGYVE